MKTFACVECGNDVVQLCIECSEQSKAILHKVVWRINGEIVKIEEEEILDGHSYSKFVFGEP